MVVRGELSGVGFSPLSVVLVVELRSCGSYHCVASAVALSLASMARCF